MLNHYKALNILEYVFTLIYKVKFPLFSKQHGFKYVVGYFSHNIYDSLLKSSLFQIQEKLMIGYRRPPFRPKNIDAMFPMKLWLVVIPRSDSAGGASEGLVVADLDDAPIVNVFESSNPINALGALILFKEGTEPRSGRKERLMASVPGCPGIP